MSEDTKKCQFCSETIKAEAIRCRFCDSDLPVVKTLTNMPSTRDSEQQYPLPALLSMIIPIFIFLAAIMAQNEDTFACLAILGYFVSIGVGLYVIALKKEGRIMAIIGLVLTGVLIVLGTIMELSSSGK